LRNLLGRSRTADSSIHWGIRSRGRHLINHSFAVLFLLFIGFGQRRKSFQLGRIETGFMRIGESIDKAILLLGIHVLIRQEFPTRIREHF
jgi:hypothetical protein